jgi:DNA-binding transcriptional MerR regulator
MADAPPQLPDKLYFKIGEVAKLVGVKPYVLRYWETEFPSVRPGKTRSKHRLYRRRDVEALLEIKRLLHKERYTIEGAKKRLRAWREDGDSAAVDEGAEAMSPDETGETAQRNADRGGDGGSGESEKRGVADDAQMSLPLGDSAYRKALVQVKRGLEEIYDLLKE